MVLADVEIIAVAAPHDAGDTFDVARFSLGRRAARHARRAAVAAFADRRRAAPAASASPLAAAHVAPAAERARDHEQHPYDPVHRVSHDGPLSTRRSKRETTQKRD